MTELDKPEEAAEPSGSPSRVAERHLQENIETIAELTSRAAEKVDPHQRTIERLAAQIGQPRSITLAAAAMIVWISVNLLFIALGRRPPDPPPFFWMQGTVAILALLTMMIVLTKQDRQGKQSLQRAHLELQINLRAEQKVTKLIALVEELRRDIPSVRDRTDRTAEAMAQSVDPHAVISALEESFDSDEASRRR
jgi:uncharacterized membrane protein